MEIQENFTRMNHKLDTLGKTHDNLLKEVAAIRTDIAWLSKEEGPIPQAQGIWDLIPIKNEKDFEDVERQLDDGATKDFLVSFMLVNKLSLNVKSIFRFYVPDKKTNRTRG